MNSTLNKRCIGCRFTRERSDDTILWYSESLIPLSGLDLSGCRTKVTESMTN